jgi:hypothetical protein
VKKHNKREWTKENYKANGHRTQNQRAQNSFNTTIEEPGTNESGEEAKRRGF